MLSGDQNVYYDFEYVKDAYFAELTPILLDACHAGAEIHIADFGCGTGLFLDRMLRLNPGRGQARHRHLGGAPRRQAPTR